MNPGIIFDIKEFAVHDGPGTRVTVFFKGCPLRCIWCHNPEGLLFEPQVIRIKQGCDLCGKCEQPCNHAECAGLGYCVNICPKRLIRIAGERVDSAGLANRLKKYAPVFALSGGGVTISGGEPLAQPRFLLDLLRELKPLHTVLQTSGYGDSAVFEEVVTLADLVLFDIKLLDPGMHRKYTGVDNGLIHRNLDTLKGSGKTFVVRVPIIPGVNDRQEHFSEVAELLKNVKDRVTVEILPYNPLAGAKYASVGLVYRFNHNESVSVSYDLDVFKEAGIPAYIL